MFSHPYTNYIANEISLGEEQFHSKNYLLDMYHSYAKLRLKIAPQQLSIVIGKTISKTYKLDCSCK